MFTVDSCRMRRKPYPGITMNIKKIRIFALCFVLCAFTNVFAEFNDIEYSWYKDAILNLSTQWFTQGYGDGRYGTENNITRAEILTILLRASAITLPKIPDEKCFPDVDTKMWYHKYICAAHQLGIANGFEDGKFKPNDSVTTLEALAFWNKAFGLNINTSDGEKWYEQLREFADNNNIMATHGYTLGTKISRGKSAELIIRLQEYSKTKSALSYKSKGCEATHALPSKNIIQIAGKDREYNLFVPDNYSNNKQYSLIVASHGRTNSNDRVQGYMWLDRNQTDFIVAYPAWLPSGSAFSWSEKESITFFDALIQQVADNYCINRDHVFLVGHSLGGWFTQKVACLRGELVNAMAAVGSGPYGSNCTGPATSLFFQNFDDQLSSYASGVSARNTREKVNECTDVTEEIKIGPLTCTHWTECSADTSVVWCEWYTGYGNDPHSWPTGGSWRESGGGAWIEDFFRDLI